MKFERRKNCWDVSARRIATAHSCLTQGFIPKPALEELKHLKGTIRVHWVPGHTGLAGNERANLLAREALLRVPANYGQTQKPVTPPKLQPKEYADSKRKFTPHKKLSRQQQTTIRLTQTQTLLTPDKVYMYKGCMNTSPPECDECHVPINQEHMLWLCPKVDRSSIRREWLTQPATLEQQLSLASFVQKTIGTPPSRLDPWKTN